jgi:hypothetical protein
VVVIVGQTYVQDELEKILQSRNNSTTSVKKITSAEEATCDIAFLPKKQNSMFSTIVENTSRKSILIATESSWAYQERCLYRLSKREEQARICSK